MLGNLGRQLLPRALSILLVITSVSTEAVGQQGGSPVNTAQGTSLSATELQQLVAPIALYPDALVAQILRAESSPSKQTDRTLAVATRRSCGR